jgi:hypothetical protein
MFATAGESRLNREERDRSMSAHPFQMRWLIQAIEAGRAPGSDLVLNALRHRSEKVVRGTSMSEGVRAILRS